MSEAHDDANELRGSTEQAASESITPPVWSALALVLFPFCVAFQGSALGWARFFVSHVLTAALALGAAGFLHFRTRTRSLRAWLRPVGILVAFLVVWTCVLRIGPERHELQREGDGIMQCLESFRREHGRYPATLAEAGCEPGWNRFGGWRYRVADSGQAYALDIGEYSRDGFHLSRYGDGWWMDS